MRILNSTSDPCDARVKSLVIYYSILNYSHKNTLNRKIKWSHSFVARFLIIDFLKSYSNYLKSIHAFSIIIKNTIILNLKDSCIVWIKSLFLSNYCILLIVNILQLKRLMRRTGHQSSRDLFLFQLLELGTTSLMVALELDLIVMVVTLNIR